MGRRSLYFSKFNVFFNLCFTFYHSKVIFIIYIYDFYWNILILNVIVQGLCWTQIDCSNNENPIFCDYSVYTKMMPDYTISSKIYYTKKIYSIYFASILFICNGLHGKIYLSSRYCAYLAWWGSISPSPGLSYLRLL